MRPLLAISILALSIAYAIDESHAFSEIATLGARLIRSIKTRRAAEEKDDKKQADDQDAKKQMERIDALEDIFSGAPKRTAKADDSSRLSWQGDTQDLDNDLMKDDSSVAKIIKRSKDETSEEGEEEGSKKDGKVTDDASLDKELNNDNVDFMSTNSKKSELPGKPKDSSDAKDFDGDLMGGTGATEGNLESAKNEVKKDKEEKPEKKAADDKNSETHDEDSKKKDGGLEKKDEDSEKKPEKHSDDKKIYEDDEEKSDDNDDEDIDNDKKSEDVSEKAKSKNNSFDKKSKIPIPLSDDEDYAGDDLPENSSEKNFKKTEDGEISERKSDFEQALEGDKKSEKKNDDDDFYFSSAEASGKDEDDDSKDDDSNENTAGNKVGCRTVCAPLMDYETCAVPRCDYKVGTIKDLCRYLCHHQKERCEEVCE